MNSTELTQGNTALQAIAATPMALQAIPVTPMTLIERAQAQGATIEQMAQLFELKMRVEADEARKAFLTDFTAFKAEAIVIVKNVEIKDGPLKGKHYADLFGVISAVTPALSRHRLSFRFETPRDEPAWIEVACVLIHEQGHEVRERKGAEPDKGPGRNSIQARISTTSYLERTTLLGVLGLAARGMDDDAQAAGAAGNTGIPTMPEAQLVARLDAIRSAQNVDELKQAYLPALKEAQHIGDKAAEADLGKAKVERWNQLKGGK